MLVTTDPVEKSREPLNGRFVRFCIGDVATQLGSAVSLVILPLIAVTALHATPMQVGLLTACDRLPFILFSLSAGLSADRWERRRILLVCNVLRCLLLAILLSAARSGELAISTFAIVMFLVGTTNVYFEVAYWTFVPALLPPSKVARGNGVLASIAGAAEMVGPALGGFLLSTATLVGALLFNSLLFACGAGVLATLPRSIPPSRDVSAAGGRFTAIMEGMRELLGRPELRSLVVTGAAWNFLACGATPQILVHMSRTLGLSTEQIGLVLAIQGLGGMLGSLVAGRVAGRLGDKRAILCGALVYGLFSLAIVVVGGHSDVSATALGALLFVAAAGSSIGVVNIITRRQALTPDALLGRVTAGFRFITWGVMPPAALLGGLLAQTCGTRMPIMLACAVGLGLLAIAAWRRRNATSGASNTSKVDVEIA